jgi:hypothetical protein
MTYITIFYDFFYTVTNDKIKKRRQLSKLKHKDTRKQINNTISNNLEYWGMKFSVPVVRTSPVG